MVISCDASLTEPLYVSSVNEIAMCHYSVEASSPYVCGIRIEASVPVEQDMEVGERMTIQENEDQLSVSDESPFRFDDGEFPLDDTHQLPLDDEDQLRLDEDQHLQDDYPYQSGMFLDSLTRLESSIIDQIRNEIVDLSAQLHELQQILEHLDHFQVCYKHRLKLLPHLHSYKPFNPQNATTFLSQFLKHLRNRTLLFIQNI